MKELFHNFLFQPIYNALVVLIDVIPGSDVGLAVILLTIIIKLALFPLSAKMVSSQIQMKILQKPMEEIRLKYKNSQEEMGRAMLELYQKHNINPFSGILIMFIQIPVIFALYWVFYRGGLPNFNTEWVYSFVPIPEAVNMNFLGLINVGESKSIVLALLVGITQYFQARFSLPKQEPKPADYKNSIQDDIMRGMQLQIKYILPVIITVTAYNLITVISIYWIISNLFAIGQEIFIRNHIRGPEEERVNKQLAGN